MDGIMQVKDLVCNRNFDVNCNYSIYYGTWNDKGELLWDSSIDGDLDEDNSIGNMNVTYITIDYNTKSLVIECL